MLQYASAAPASRARRMHSESRTSSLPRSYGDAFGTTSRPAPDRRHTATGPPSCHRSSQIATATSTPSASEVGTRNTGSVFPGTKYRYSSNTP